MSDRRDKLAARRKDRLADMGDVLDNVKEKTVRRATGRSTKGGMTVGRFVRRQFTFYPDTLAGIRTMAEELGTTEADAARWCMERGLLAYRSGETPETAPVEGVTIRRPQ